MTGSKGHGSDEHRNTCEGRVNRRGFIVGAAAAASAAGLSRLPGPSEAHARGVPRTEEESLAIPRRPLGRTGIEVPIVAMGCGSRFYRAIPDSASAADLLRRGIEAGIAFVETSANYGDGISERWVGRAMATHRDGVLLETKVDERDYDGAMREMERSLERLNTDRLDLVLHHFLREDDEVRRAVAPGGAEAAIRTLMDQGVVRSRGFSTHRPDLALRAMDAFEPDAIQLPVNAVRTPDFESDVLPAAAERGVGVLAMKTCGNGYFHPAHATEPDRIERYGPPEGAWERWDLPTWTEYIHYVLSLPITSAVIGVDSHFTLDGVLAAAASFEGPFERADMNDIASRARVFRTTGYWLP